MQMGFNSAPTVVYVVLTQWCFTMERRGFVVWGFFFFFLRGRRVRERLNSVLHMLRMRGLELGGDVEEANGFMGQELRGEV